MDVSRAISRNTHWSAALGWGAHFGRIASLFPTPPSTPAEFAEATAHWQHFHHPRLQPDGIIGPRTWTFMRRDLGIARETPPYCPPEAEREATGLVHHTLTVKGVVLDFYFYERIPGAAAKLEELRQYFARMPAEHLAAVYPIFIVRRLPGGAKHGGTFRPGGVAGVLRSPAHARNTGLVLEEAYALTVTQGRGFIGIPRNRWDRPARSLCFTVIHEAAHSIDVSFPHRGLTPNPYDEEVFRHVAPTCGGPPDKRRVVEAYARWICDHHAIAGNLPAGRSHAAQNARIIAALRTADAFRGITALP